MRQPKGDKVRNYLMQARQRVHLFAYYIIFGIIFRILFPNQRRRWMNRKNINNFFQRCGRCFEKQTLTKVNCSLAEDSLCTSPKWVPQNVTTQWDKGKLNKCHCPMRKRIQRNPHFSKLCRFRKVLPKKRKQSKKRRNNYKYPYADQTSLVGQQHMLMKKFECVSVEEHSKRLITRKDYDAFKERLLKHQIPKYIQYTYLDEELNKICIDIVGGNRSKCMDFLEENFPLEYQEGVFDVMEIGKASFCILDHGTLSAKSDSSEQVTTDLVQEEASICPGQKMTSLRNGCQIRTASCSGTLGAIMKDKNRKCYGITAMHLMNTIPGNSKGKTEIKCDVLNEKCANCMIDFVLGNNFYGILGPFSLEKNFVDIAAFELELNQEFLDLNIDIDTSITNTEDIIPHDGCCSNLLERKVFMNGAKTGTVSGEIIRSGMDAYVDGKYLGTSCFLVGSEQEPFAQSGDSGALIFDEKFGYGVLSATLPEFPTRSGKCYKMVGQCTRLNICLHSLKNVFELELEFPPNIQASKEENLVEIEKEIQYKKLTNRKHAEEDIICTRKLSTGTVNPQEIRSKVGNMLVVRQLSFKEEEEKV